MIALFRAFRRERVHFLLIGGQASILYGAAHFTQDLDLWIRPDPANVRAFLRALARAHARCHKLTPPLSPRWVLGGHGFHFRVPESSGSFAYLDVMGRPPRAGSFAAAARRSRPQSTRWGRIPVVSIEDLVDLKRTNRPGDYETVSRLVRFRLGESRTPSLRLLAWGLRNTFRLEDLQAIASTYGARAWTASRSLPSPIRAVLRPGTVPDRALAAAAKALDRRMARCLEAGRRYWSPRLRELKSLRSAGGLLPEGMPVRSLLRPGPSAEKFRS